jgi:hypothetical protein
MPFLGSLTMRAMLLLEPQECVQPRVPWPVLKNKPLILLRPMVGTLLIDPLV